ncbi:MAG: hypothetical protein ACTSRU_13175, partial [Candidatus Hodarchaeales archaeon]
LDSFFILPVFLNRNCTTITCENAMAVKSDIGTTDRRVLAITSVELFPVTKGEFDNSELSFDRNIYGKPFS